MYLRDAVISRNKSFCCQHILFQILFVKNLLCFSTEVDVFLEVKFGSFLLNSKEKFNK